MVWKDQESPSVWVDDSQESILTNLNDGIGLWVNLLVRAEALHLIFDYASSSVPLSDHTEVICRAPDASPVVSGRDSAVWKVDDLVTVFQVTDHLGLASDYSLNLLPFILSVIAEH